MSVIKWNIKVFYSLKFITTEECDLNNLNTIKALLAESFYYVDYGLSIITSKVSQIFSVTKINTGASVVFKRKHELKCHNKLFLKFALC